MENYSYSSYPDSVNSSPRSREIDVENPSWEDQPPSNYKVKLLCSYGGKIQPRPHDNQLTYIGGDTKILAVDRHIKFINLLIKLSSISDCDITFKYQLPGEDLDALISVTNDEDLDHMMLEYDRLSKSSPKPPRLRLFLFPLNALGNSSSFGSTDSKSERQWFVDALNSAVTEQQSSPPMAPVATSQTPDYLFGLENKTPQDISKQTHTVPLPGNDFQAGREVHRQIEELQRLQISDQDQSPRYYGTEYQPQPPPPPQQTGYPVNTPSGAYWQDRGTDQPVYLIQTPSGIYQAPQQVRQMTGQVSQGYYGMQRMVPEVYRDQQIYNQVPQQNQQVYSGVYNTEAVGFRPPAPESAYSQVPIDGVGRQVYYTTPGGLMVAPPVQAVSAAGATQFIPTNQGIATGGGPGYGPEGKGTSKVSQPPPSM